MSFVTYDVDLDTVSTTRFASSVATGAGTDLALTETRTVDGAAHLVTLKGDAVTDHSAKTFTLVGTDQDGLPQTEDIAGPNGTATVTSTKYFQTLTSVSASATCGSDTFDIGFAAPVMSRAFALPIKDVAIPIQVDITGTINYGCQVTLAAPGTANALWVADGNLTNETADQLDYLSKYGLSQVRFIINSYSAGAELHAYIAAR